MMVGKDLRLKNPFNSFIYKFSSHCLSPINSFLTIGMNETFEMP
jgi:hypothetical protein